MELTVLGCGGGVPLPGGALCGHLLTHDDQKIWVDAGNGTLGELLKYASITDIDAVIISHRHFDHFLDLYPFSYAREQLAELGELPSCRLIAPPDFLEYAEQIDGLQWFLDWTPLEPGDSLDLGGMAMQTAAMTHGVPTLGMRFTAGDRTIAYSADTGPCDELIEIARDADVFVCEAMFGAGAVSSPLHLSAQQAGEHAQRAGAKSLTLTHVLYLNDLDAAVAAARSAYDGPVTAAKTGATLTP